MYDGASSPMTQTFGLGLFQPATAADLDAIEAFYAERGSPVFHEVSPMADAALPALLTARGYRPFEFSSVMYRPIDLAGLESRASSDPAQGRSAVAQGVSPAVGVRLIEKGEEELYARVFAAGWGALEAEFILELGRVNGAVEGMRLFLAELDGKAIAAGALGLCDGVAHLAGASTMLEGRNRGAQFALLDHRLRYAADHGCDIALMAALPGSGSQRNAERNGFRIAYTRIKWQR